jgi:chitodextrinase
LTLLFAMAVPVTPALAAVPEFSSEPEPGWMTNGVGDVREFANIGDTVFVGGTFTAVRATRWGADEPPAYLAAFDRNTGARVDSFQPTINHQVRAIVAATDGSAVYAAGWFNNVNGLTRNRVVKLNPVTGATIATFNANVTGGAVYAVDLTPSGELILGGSFTAVNGVARTRLAMVDGTTGALLPWAPSANGSVRDVHVPASGDRAYVGGDFSSVNSSPSTRNLAAIDLATGATIPFSAQPGYTVHDLDSAVGTLYVALGGPGGRGLAYRMSDGAQLGSWWGDGDVQAVHVAGDTAYFGGHFVEEFGGEAALFVGGVNIYDHTVDTSFAPRLNGTMGVWGIHFDGAYLWLGGAISDSQPFRSRGFIRVAPQGPLDTTPPTQPTGLTADTVTGETVSLSWNAATDDSGSVNYRIEQDGVAVGATTDLSYTVGGLAGETGYTFHVVALDPSGNESAPSDPVFAQTLKAPIDFVSFGDTWRYLDDGSDQGTAWREPGFNDSAWASGPAELGYGDGDEATVVYAGPVPDRYITTYYRTDFEVANPSEFIGIDLSVVRDDGVVVYLNGTEIARDNMPTGPVGYLTRAVAGISGVTIEATPVTFVVDPGALVAGTNVMAVEIHQVGPGSSDTSMDVSLRGLPVQDATAPTVPQNLRTTALTADQVDLEWDASTDDTLPISYEVRRDGVLIDTTTNTTIIDTAVVESTSYSYDVTAIDPAGNTSPPSTPLPVTTPGEPPTQPHNLTATGVTFDQVNLSWDASTDVSLPISYEVRRDGVLIDTVPDTTFSDTERTAGATYSYEVTALDAFGNASLPSAPLPVTLPIPDTTPPSQPQNLVAVLLNAVDAELTWDASTDDSGSVVYEVRRNGVVIITTAATTFQDLGLPGATTFSYDVTAVDPSGNSSAPSDPDEVTTPTPDTTPPAQPGNLRTTAITTTSIDLEWDASTDDSGSVEYELYRDGLLVVTQAGTTYSDGPLEENAAFTYQVIATDPSHNPSPASDPLPAATLAVAPSEPGSLAVTVTGETSIELSWTASSDDSLPVSYEVRRDGVLVETTAAVTYTDLGLAEDTTYGYEVTAVDAVGLASTPATITGSTASIAPAQPQNLTATATSGTTIALDWDPVVDAGGGVTYDVFGNGVFLVNTASPFYTHSGLAPGTTNTYSVTAVDGGGNASPPSDAASATTPVGSIEFVTWGDTWRYLDDGSDQGTAWRETSFDDALWSAGAAELGYGDGDETTVVYSGPDSNHFLTTYFRNQFTVTNPNHFGDLTLDLIRDDGAVVYLNGTEVVRTNMPAGAITSTTRASLGIAGLDEFAVNTFAIPTGHLVAGTNVIAVEIHQQSPQSSDISMDLRLEAAPADDTGPPTQPTTLTATTVTAAQVDLAWSPSTDDSGTVSYEIRRDGVPLGTTTATTYQDTTVVESTSYSYDVTAFDPAGNTSPPSTPLPVTTPGEPPTQPQNLTATLLTDVDAELTWDPSTDDSGIVSYEIRRNGVLLGTTPETTYQDLGLAAATTFTYDVAAVDGVGNSSAPSDPDSVTTPAPDTTPPTQPTNPATTGVGTVTVDLTWDASTDDRGVVTYRVLRDGTVIGTTALTSFSDAGLAEGGSFSYEIVAFDPAGNESAPSSALPITTSTAPPTQPTGLTATAASPTSVDLAWVASTDDTTPITYDVRRDGAVVGSTTDTTFTDVDVPSDATYDYTVTPRDGLDIVGPESNPASVTLVSGPQQVIAPGATWRYLDNGSDQGTAWRETTFDDGGWASGAAEFGYGDGDETTVIASGPEGDRFLTAYFRTEFSVAAAGAVGQLEINLLRDDGAVVYLNGVELFRDNMPAGVISFATRASAHVAGLAEDQFITYTVPASALVTGTNVMAVEVHQSHPNSSDTSFDLELITLP